jgi:hypothetical protein
MRSNIRLQLNSASSCDAFCREHPDPNPATALVATHLGGLVGKANALAQLQHSSQVARAAAVERKKELRESIANGMAALVGISRVAVRSDPGSSVELRALRGRTNESGFLTTARVAVAEAGARKEIFVKLGMPETLLDSMTAELDEYEAVQLRQRNAHAAQVGASAELTAVTREIMATLRHLDSLHRLRFKNAPDLQAAWKSARNVAYRLPEPAEGEEEAA